MVCWQRGGLGRAVPFGVGMALLCLVVASASAAEPDWRRAVQQALPSLWQLESLASRTPADASDDAGAGESFVRFTAPVALTEATFTVVRRQGPFTIVRPVAQAGLRKIVTGRLRGAGNGGNDAPWAVDFDNPDVLAHIGLPLTVIPGRPLVLGSAEGEAELAALRTEAEASRRAAAVERQRLEAQLAQERAAAEAEAAVVDARRRAVAARAEALAALYRQFGSAEHAERRAALEAGMAGSDPAVRAAAFEAAYTGDDAVAANLALRLFLNSRAVVPISLFATRDNPQSGRVLGNLGALTLTIDGFDPVGGSLSGRLGAPGFTVTRESSVVGSLARTQLTLATHACTLTLRLSPWQTLDGIYRCQTLPTLIARIALE